MSLFIGLTGGIGSGKTTVSNAFKDKGITIVDTDQIARDVVAPGTPSLNTIQKHFGSDILNDDGTLDRKKLRDIIFSDPNEKTWLEALLHPVIREATRKQLKASTSAYTILSSPLLLESPDAQLVQRTLVVDIPEATQVLRTTQRDNTSAAQTQQIIASQMPRQERLQLADDILDNSSSEEATLAQVETLHDKYLQLAKQNHER